ncbi:MAG: MFS transporter [Clostridiales bacterium]|nr:MFS transporter [Clostridiales bacterium]
MLKEEALVERDAELLSKEPLWTRDFILISIATLLIFLGFQMLLPVLPIYSVKLGGSDAWAGMVMGVFTVSAVIMRPIAGRLIDRQGRRGIFLLGLIVIILSVFAHNWAPTILILLILRFIHGFGWGASSTASSTIASDIIPKSRLGEGMGFFGLTGTFGMAIGPAYGLWLLKDYDFNTVFYISSGIVLVSIIIALPIKYPILETSLETEKKGIIEKTAMLPAIVMFFITMNYGSIVSFIALYAGQKRVENIGLFFTVYAAALLISRPYFGRLTDRKGISSAVYPGIIFVILSMFLIYYANSLSTFLIAGFIYGIGFGAIQPALLAMSVRNVSYSRRGAANATFYLGFDLGIGVGSVIWGIIADYFGYQTVYLLSIIPVIVVVLIYIIRSVK